MPDIDGLKGTPRRTIQMWSGLQSDIPRKWQLCDGTNGTPDMLSRFIKGSPDGVDGGDTGGEDTHVLTEDELPPHGHGLTTSAHRHTIPVMPEFPEIVRTDIIRGNAETNFTWAQTISGISTGFSGADNAHENKPPFYELAYIMKVE